MAEKYMFDGRTSIGPFVSSIRHSYSTNHESGRSSALHSDTKEVSSIPLSNCFRLKLLVLWQSHQSNSESGRVEGYSQ